MATPATAAPKKMGTPRPNPKKRKPDGKVGQAASAKKAKSLRKAVCDNVVAKKESGTALANQNKLTGMAAAISKTFFGPTSSELELRAKVEQLTHDLKLEKATKKMISEDAQRLQTRFLNAHADLKEERRLKSVCEERLKKAVEDLTSIQADAKKKRSKHRQAMKALKEKNVKLEADIARKKHLLSRMSTLQDELVSALKKSEQGFDKARIDLAGIYLKANRVAITQKRLEEDGNRLPAVEALDTVVADLDVLQNRLSAGAM